MTDKVVKPKVVVKEIDKLEEIRDIIEAYIDEYKLKEITSVKYIKSINSTFITAGELPSDKVTALDRFRGIVSNVLVKYHISEVIYNVEDRSLTVKK